MECPSLFGVLPLCLGINLAASISIVVVNKWLYTYYVFPNITLTAVHFAVTWLGLLLCSALGIFRRKDLPVLRVLPLCLAFCGFVVFTNLSLENNTVGTYQLAKAMTTPCIVLIHTYMYNRPYSHMIKLTLVSGSFFFFLLSFRDIFACERRAGNE